MSGSPSIELAKEKLQHIKAVVLVGSGKGGVGKSIISSSIALSFAKMGFKTGLLDVDLHGPSLHKILKCKFSAESSVRGLKPCNAYGLKFMSIAFFVDEDSPLPIRGDAKASLARDLFAQTDWGELDYLVVDLPPGTGDEVLSILTLFESKSSAVVVSTPSRLSISVVERLINLLKRERIPILGLIENMSYIRYNDKKIHLFGSSSSRILSEKYDIEFLGELPLDPGVEDAIARGGTPLDSKLFAMEFERITGRIIKKIANFPYL